LQNAEVTESRGVLSVTALLWKHLHRRRRRLRVLSFQELCVVGIVWLPGRVDRQNRQLPERP
jgi:hypothetical protein